MLSQNIFFISFKKLLYNSLRDILYFPVWWYTKGLKNKWKSTIRTIESGNDILGVTLWYKSILKPMYAQKDFAGRLISFGMRLVIALARTILFLLWILISLISIIVWVILPIFIISQIVYQIIL